MNLVLENLDFPIVIKPQNGTIRRGFSIAHNKSDIRKYSDSNGKNPIIFQEYIDIVSSMRVLTIGGRPVGSVYCIGTKDFSGLQNAERIAKDVIFNNPSSILKG